MEKDFKVTNRMISWFTNLDSYIETIPDSEIVCEHEAKEPSDFIIGKLPKYLQKMDLVLRTLSESADRANIDWMYCKKKDKESKEIEMHILFSQREILNELFWTSILIHFNLSCTEVLTIRENFTLVRIDPSEVEE